MRTSYDIENDAAGRVLLRHRELLPDLDAREAGHAPATLIDYFPDDFLLVIDESHVTVRRSAVCTRVTRRANAPGRARLPAAERRWTTGR